MPRRTSLGSDVSDDAAHRRFQKEKQMPVYARRKPSNFTPAPEGLHNAVCADVWPQWTEERREEWGGGLQDKTRIVWLIEEINPKTNKPYEASQAYTLSLHPKANLSKVLEAWRGRPFTDKEREQFDVESVVGVSCQIQVVHNLGSDGTVYSNVQAVVPLGKGQTKLRVYEGYVRKKDRDQQQDQQQQGEAPFEPGEDDVPF
jgi:hypothetical protein